METLEWLRAIGIEKLIFAISLGMPRLFALFTVTPFLGGGIVTGPLRITIVIPLMLFILSDPARFRIFDGKFEQHRGGVAYSCPDA